MVTPLEIAKLCIRNLIRLFGWVTVAKIVQEEKPGSGNEKTPQ